LKTRYKNPIQTLAVALFSKKGLLWMMGILALAFLVSLKNRFIQSDENWFGEQAYWLLNEGVVRLKSMPLVNQASVRIYAIYKLHVYVGAGLIKLFGWHFWIFKAYVLALFILFLIIYRRFIIKHFPNQERWFWMLPVFVLISTPLVLEQAIIFRPDVAMMLLGFCSFLFLYRAIKEERENLVILAGLMAGLSFLTHFNGNVFAITGFIYLLSYRKYKAWVKYSLVTFFVSMLYFWDMTNVESIKAFIGEFQNVPNEAVKLKGNIALIRLKALFTEHQRFFWSYRAMATSALFFFMLIVYFKSLIKQIPEIMRYFLILVISLNLFGAYVAERFLLYYLPIMALITALGIQRAMENRKNRVLVILLLLLVFQGVNLATSFKMVFKYNANYPEIHEELARYIPKHEKVLAPWEFIFNQIDNYTIYSYKNVEYYNLKRVTNEELASIITRLDVNYIIVAQEFANLTQYPFHEIRTTGLPHYKPLYANSNYVILKREPQE